MQNNPELKENIKTETKSIKEVNEDILIDFRNFDFQNLEIDIKPIRKKIVKSRSHQSTNKSTAEKISFRLFYNRKRFSILYEKTLLSKGILKKMNRFAQLHIILVKDTEKEFIDFLNKLHKFVALTLFRNKEEIVELYFFTNPKESDGLYKHIKSINILDEKSINKFCIFPNLLDSYVLTQTKSTFINRKTNQKIYAPKLLSRFGDHFYLRKTIFNLPYIIVNLETRLGYIVFNIVSTEVTLIDSDDEENQLTGKESNNNEDHKFRKIDVEELLDF
jgi:hypothetical protein